MCVFFLSTSWRWSHDRLNHVCDHYAIKLHPEYQRAFADFSVHFMHLETYWSISQTLNRRSDDWADDESNEFWKMWKHGIESYFGIDAQKLLGQVLPISNTRGCREQIRNVNYLNITFECYVWWLNSVVLGSKCSINLLSAPRVMSKHVTIFWSHWTRQCSGLISSFVFPG